MARGQLPLALLEVAIGVVLVLSVVLALALGVAPPDTREPQLDAYAGDATSILANDPPRHGDTTRLAEVLASEATFDRERDALAARVDRILPANLLYRVETPHGAVGYPMPSGVVTGRSAVTTAGGAVTVKVWYV